MTVVLAFAGVAHGADKKSTQDIMLEDTRLNHTSCLRMISSMKCVGSGDEGSSSANCKLQMAYRLASGEIAAFPIQSNDSKTHGADNGLTYVARMSALMVTLGASEKAIAAIGASASTNRAENEMRIQLAQIAEQLQLKDIKKCQDFKDESKTVYSESSSHVGE